VPFLCDKSGNLLHDGEKAYSWDAVDRLVRVKFLHPQAEGRADTVEFRYNGIGQRMGITEKREGVLLSDKTFVWCGIKPCEERDSSGVWVKKRFYHQGEFHVSGPSIGSLFYTTDHLGSIREMTNSTGALEAQYGYGPWGQRTRTAGTVDAQFGFTGFFRHEGVGLDLTWFRAYDPGKARWVSSRPVKKSPGRINGIGFEAFSWVTNPGGPS
jgi:RHS repeat-associated protein